MVEGYVWMDPHTHPIPTPYPPHTHPIPTPYIHVTLIAADSPGHSLVAVLRTRLASSMLEILPGYVSLGGGKGLKLHTLLSW